MDPQAEKNPGTSNSPSDSAEELPQAERQSAYVANAPLAIMVVDGSGRYVEVNPAACRISGYDEAELLTKSLTDLLAEESQEAGRKHFSTVQQLGRAHGEVCWIHKDGTKRWSVCDAVKLSEDRFLAYFLDVTDRRQNEQERQIAIEFLHLVNISDGTRDLIRRATGFFQEQSGCEAVGVRLREGDDYPYYETHGFPAEFILAENSLCVRGENGEPRQDDDGNPVLECMCGNVICGRFDTSKPFFSPAGSFWTNGTTELLASTTEADRLTHTRNRCNSEGYESVALIRLRSGSEPLGLLQLNDHRRGVFTAETIALWERLAGHLAAALARARAEEELRQSEERLKEAQSLAHVGSFHYDFAAGTIWWSDETYRLFGLEPGTRSPTFEEVVAMIHPEDLAHWESATKRAILAGKSVVTENRIVRPDGSVRHHYVSSSVKVSPEGQPLEISGTVQDITDRKQAEQEKLELERRLLHAQKLESLGVLAGGIAHDFNNILAGIMGYADLALVRLPSSEPTRADIEVIKKSVRRAADLTRQMLAYSGKGKFIVEAVSLSRVVEEMHEMLEVSISKKAVWKCSLASDLPTISADASQIHQVILNLVINASEALSEQNGVIAISTDTVHGDAADFAGLGFDNDLPEGLYVRLEVSDTGCGMDQKTVEKIFDPFFTTKFAGRGLGLAAVQGIIRGHKGAIRVSSVPGKGTAFQVLFPAETPAAATLPGAAGAGKAWRGSGTVLVVDDEETIRNLARRMMERVGLSVLTAKDGEEALQVYRQHQKDIACVLLDLTMPKMNGEETFRALQKICPNVRVLLSSGYSEEAATGRFAGLGLAGFIQKPYHLDAMIAKLQRVFDEE